MMRIFVFLASLLSVMRVASAIDIEAEQLAFFENKVRPLLVEYCYECHSHGSEISGGLALDSSAGWQKGGDSGVAINPGKPADSLLMKAVRYQDADLEMPPDGKLDAGSIETLRKWIEMGAPDPRTEQVADAAPEKKGPIQISALDLWSLQPITRPEPPSISDPLWAREPIDAFVKAKLDEAKLLPAPPAEARMLFRRLYLNLIGLPPGPEEMDAFLVAAADYRESAVRQTVDTLLASQSYGERWARHWLDLTAYADTLGVGRAIPAIEAYRYRDYVIDAFNHDKPLPEFIRQQIAGDIQVPGAPGQQPTDPPTAEDIIATGFLAIGPWELVSGDKEQLRMDVVDRQVNRIGKAFLGMTLECARCHAHKSDPVSQEDYYAMAGILRSSITLDRRLNGVFSNVNYVELPETADQLIERAERIRQFERDFAEATSARDGAAKDIREQQAVVNQLKKAKEKSAESDSVPEELAAAEASLEQAKKRLADATKRRSLLAYLRPHRTKSLAIAMQDRPEPEVSAINIRGNAHQLGEPVPRGFISTLAPTKKPQFKIGTSGRLDLADWIADPDNPLTARVWVNRIWHHLFGVGLVRTVDNFGVTGEAPSHPELLDYLAGEFQKDWSTKNLIRRIVLSQAWQQSSINSAAKEVGADEIDPSNRLLWRAYRRRIEAETLHDAMLAVSGELNQSHRGGPALPLDDPANFNPASTGIVETNLKLPADWKTRRAIFQPQRRADPFESVSFVAAFDVPSTNSETGMRGVTAVPAQALNLVNSSFIAERAAALSNRVDDSDPQSRVTQLYREVYGRSPSEREIERCLDFISAMIRGLDGDEAQAWQKLCQSLLMSNEFLFRT